MGRKQSELKSILQEIVVDGSYQAAQLSDDNGLSLAAVHVGESSGEMAAITSLLRNSAKKACQHLDMAHVNELSLVGDDRFRFVCRFFEIENGQPMILTLVVPPDQAYRRTTNQAIKRIQQVWSN
jgi:predicted regulator of Ras-like GTPase activity (Roadblock/LC7/MglB family)